jgi:hypothetical protein
MSRRRTPSEAVTRVRGSDVVEHTADWAIRTNRVTTLLIDTK